jgi:hypothetical protein
MKYFIIPESGLAIECHCDSERYLALEMETPSPVAGYPAEPWRRDANARDSGGLKSQFMSSAKRWIRDGAGGGP